MRIKPAIGSVVGETSATSWSQVLTLPYAYGVVEVADEDGVARTHGVRILTELTHRLEHRPLSLKEIEAVVNEIADEGVRAIGVVIPVGMILYIVLYGEGSVYLKRGEMLATLLNHPGSISGEVQASDTLLLATGGITQALSREEISDTFDHLPAIEAAEKLTLLLHQKAGLKSGAALVFQVATLEEEETYDEDPPSETTDFDTPSIEGTDDQQDQLPVRRRRTNVFSRLLADISRLIRLRRLPSRSGVKRRLASVYRNPRYLKAAVVTVLIAVFGISVVLGVHKQSANTVNTEFSQAYDAAKKAFDEGVALRDLNPVKSREKIKEADTLLEPFTKTVPATSKEGVRLATLLKEVKDNYEQILKRYSVKPEIFYDVSLLKKDARAGAVALSGDTLAIIDSSGSTVYAVDVPSKNGSIAGGGEYLHAARLAAATDNEIYVFAADGIYRIPYLGSQKKQPVVEKSDTWGNIGAMVAFGGNLYLLDTQKSRIWKYIGTDGEFSDAHEYLTPDTLPDLTQATGMAIDGYIYVGTADGKVLKYSAGVPASFVPQGIDPPLSGVVYVYTDADANFIYLLDKANKRVVVLDKDGMYAAQYVWDQPIVPSMFVVSETARKVLLLSDGLIYSFDLK